MYDAVRVPIRLRIKRSLGRLRVALSQLGNTALVRPRAGNGNECEKDQQHEGDYGHSIARHQTQLVTSDKANGAHAATVPGGDWNRA